MTFYFSYYQNCAEYAKANGIAEQPAFAWWVPEIINKKNHIINKIKTKYWHTSHKFEIEIPKSIEHAEDFAYNHYQDISKMAKRVLALPVQWGGIQFGQVHILKLKAFLWWLKDHQWCNLPLDLNGGGFGEEQMTEAIQQYMAEEEMKEANDTVAKAPDKFPHIH